MFLFLTVLTELSSMVFLVLVRLDSSNKISVGVLHVLQEPHGMVKSVPLKVLKPVLLDMFSTLIFNSANHQLLHVVIMLTLTELLVFVFQDII